MALQYEVEAVSSGEFCWVALDDERELARSSVTYGSEYDALLALRLLTGPNRADLIERMQKAALDLDRLAILRHEEHGLASMTDYYRLKGKAEGVRLALSYLLEERRAA